MKIVTKDNFPSVCASFRLIEEDNGGHLIGTVYPGERINLEAFEVPDLWEHLVSVADAALLRLKNESPEDWEIFIIGEESHSADIGRRQGDLAEASTLLNAFFDGWETGASPVRLGGR
jgi:hypothetical protein